MDPNRKPDRILSDWDALANRAQPPTVAPRRHRSLAGIGASVGLLGAGVLAAALIVAVVALGGRITPSVGGPAPSLATASQVAVASTPPTASPTSSPSTPSRPATPPPTSAPVESSAPATSSCRPDTLSARITMWEGAAGSRIATIAVRNGGPAACDLVEPTSLALVDGAGRSLIRGTGPAASSPIRLAAGATASTLVETSNYCGAPPKAPVTVRFDLDGHELTATAPSSTDATVPPCNGATVPASIQMQPWSR